MVRVRKGADVGEVAEELRVEAERWARVARQSNKEGVVGRPDHHPCNSHGDCCRHCLPCIRYYCV